MKVSSSSRFFATIDLDGIERTILKNLFRDVAALLNNEDPDSAATDTGPTAADLSEHLNDPQAHGTSGVDTPTVAELEKLFGTSAVEKPTDPALLRLLPDVDSEDAQRSEEFRRLTEFDIRSTKIAHLRTVLVTLDQSGQLQLDQQQTVAWTVALNDVRLVLATRLGIAVDDDFEELYKKADSLDGNTATMVGVYDFLTWAQEQITGVLLGRS